jgi:hypothetical protein
MMTALRTAVFLSVLTLVSISSAGGGDTKEWNWTSTQFAPCQGIGIGGTFATHVTALVQDSADGGKEISSLVLQVSSAAFTKGSAAVSATASIVPQSGTGRDVTLGRPTKPAIEPKPIADEAPPLYLPDNEKLVFPKAAKLKIAVSATVKTNAGTCSLGSSKKEINPFE